MKIAGCLLMEPKYKKNVP